MSAEENVEELIEQFTLAQGELLKGNSEPAKEFCSHREDVTLANPLALLSTDGSRLLLLLTRPHRSSEMANISALRTYQRT
jgi:hypothetical protein